MISKNCDLKKCDIKKEAVSLRSLLFYLNALTYSLAWIALDSSS